MTTTLQLWCCTCAGVKGNVATQCSGEVAMHGNADAKVQEGNVSNNASLHYVEHYAIVKLSCQLCRSQPL